MAVSDKFHSVTSRLESEADGKKKIIVGGHVDQDAVASAYADGSTGCGAADKLVPNMGLLSRNSIQFIDEYDVERFETEQEASQRIETIVNLTRTVFDSAGYYTEANTPEIVEGIIDTATQLVSTEAFSQWSGSIMKDDIALKGENRIVVLKTDGGGVHGHTEEKVLFNFIDGTSFDQDSYFDDTLQESREGREIFDVDVWHIRDIADKLSDGTDETQAAKLFAAGVAFQVATYVGLCDGSHRAFLATSS